VFVSTCPLLIRGNPRRAQAENPLIAPCRFARPPHISKLVKEVVRYYEHDNAEIIGILERPMIEASTIATYPILNGPDVIND
jgi:hypothetical protein